MSNNKQQTAVEWLIEQLRNNGNIRWRGTNIIELGAQAKEMEKEQIIQSYNQSWHFRDKPYETAEKYYEQTYGGNK